MKIKIQIFLYPLLTLSYLLFAQAGSYQFDIKTLKTGTAVSDSRFTNSEALEFIPKTETEAIVLPGTTNNVPWYESGYLASEILNQSPHLVNVRFEFYSKSKPDGHYILRANIGIIPGLPTQLVLPLSYLDNQHLYLPRFPRQLKGRIDGSAISARDIDHVNITLEPAGGKLNASVRIGNIRLQVAKPVPLPKLEKPIMDSLGQWTAKNWQGKTASVSELKSKMANLEKTYKAGKPNSDLGKFGGLKSLKFPATGFFRTVFDGNRWFFADPEGYAFLSAGMDCVRPGNNTAVDGFEELYQWLPDPKDPAWRDAFAEPQAGYPARLFNFGIANLIRVYGNDWFAKWSNLSTETIKHCGFNTIGNWSDKRYFRTTGLPYVLPLENFPTTQTLVFRDFPDVFSAEYRRNSQTFAAQLEPYKNDQWLLGYFLRNEPEWAFGDNNLAFEMLKVFKPSETRTQLIKWLADKYGHDVKKFNQSWGIYLNSFNDLNIIALPKESAIPDSSLKNLKADCFEFSKIMVDEYLKNPCQAVKRIDPNHLNLGMRYAYISNELCYHAGTYFDVFSLNGYNSPGPPATAKITELTGKPVMIGEFHFGALDKGLPATGIRGCANTTERGKAYRYYVEQGFARPELIGIHYFQLNDQPVSGRYDGENYNIGLIDLCQQPYTEMTNACKQTHDRIYKVALKKEKPFDTKPELLPELY